MNTDKFSSIKHLLKDDMNYFQKHLEEIFVTIKKIAEYDYRESPEELEYFESIKNEYAYLKESAIMVNGYISRFCEKNGDVFLPLYTIGILNTQLQNFKSKIQALSLIGFVHQTFQNLEVHLQSASTHLWQISTLSNYFECWSINSEINIDVFGLSKGVKFQFKEEPKI